MGALARTNARARQETEEGAGRSAGDGGTVPIATPIEVVQELPSHGEGDAAMFVRVGRFGVARANRVVRAQRGRTPRRRDHRPRRAVSSPCSAQRKCRTVISCEIDSSWATIAAAINATVSDLAAAEAL